MIENASDNNCRVSGCMVYDHVKYLKHMLLVRLMTLVESDAEVDESAEVRLCPPSRRRGGRHLSLPLYLFTSANAQANFLWPTLEESHVAKLNLPTYAIVLS